MAQERIIGVRVNEDRHGQFERAAKRDGKKVSEWLRDLGIAAISPPVPRTTPTPPDTRSIAAFSRGDDQPRSKAQELAATIPGLRVGFGVSPSTGDLPAIAPASSNEVDSDAKLFKPWILELQRLQRMGEVDPGEAADEERRKLDSVGFQTPKGWMRWTLEQRADYLDQHHPLAGPRPERQAAAPDGW